MPFPTGTGFASFISNMKEVFHRGTLLSLPKGSATRLEYKMAHRPTATATTSADPSAAWSLFLVRSMELTVFSFTIYLLL